MDYMSKNIRSDPRGLRIKAMFICKFIDASMPRVAMGRAVVYYARGAHAFSAVIRCRHCTSFRSVRQDELSYEGDFRSLV